MFTIILKKRSKSSFYRVLSGVCGNLSAGWFGLILITPGVSTDFNIVNIVKLTFNLFFGALFLWIAYKLDRKI